MTALRVAVASLALIAGSDAAAQQLVPPPVVPSREIDLTAEIDPYPPSLAWQRAFGDANGACVLGIAGERLVSIPVGLDGIPAAQVVAPLPPGSSRAHGFVGVLAPGGRLHVAMGVDRPEGGRRLSTLHSDDYGRTWSSPLALGDAATPIGSSFQSSYRQVAIDADAGGMVVIAWMPYTEGRVHVAVSSNGGESWSSPYAVSEGALELQQFGNTGLDVAILPSAGTIVVATADYVEPYWGGAVVRTTRSYDGGATFAPMRLLEGTPDPSNWPDDAFPDLAPLPDGSLGLVYSEFDGNAAGIAQLRSIDGGATWTRGARFTFAPPSSDAYSYDQIDPAIVREGDQAILHWPAGAGLTVARWDPAAGTFVDAQVRTPFVFRPNHIQGFASVTRSRGGAWLIAYLASAQPQETRYITSADGGTTWTAPLPFGADAGLRPSALPLVAPLGSDGILGARRAAEVDGDPRRSEFRTARANPPGGFGTWTPAANVLPEIGSPPAAAPLVLAVGRSGVVTLFGAADRDGTAVWARSSTDRGVTFGEPVRVSSFNSTAIPFGSSLRATATADGWVWASYFALGRTGGWDLRVNVSRDGGVTWLPQDAPVFTTTSFFPSSNTLRIAAAPGGRAWIAWTNSNDLKLTSTLDGGSTFQTIDADQSTILQSSSPFLCSAGNRIYLAWRGRLTSVGGTRSYVSWSDDGTSFAPAVEAVWPGTGNVDLACADDGSAAFAWTRSGQTLPYPYRIAVQRHSGSTFGPVVDTGVPSQPTSSLRVDLQSTAAGGLLLASEGYATAPEIVYELFAARSDGSGSTWSAPVRLDEGQPQQRLHLGIAALADPAGRTWVAWSDNPGIGGQAVFSRRSDDGGATWEPIVRLDRDEAPWSRSPSTGGPASAAAVDGAAIVGFQRLRSGNANAQAVLNADDVLDRDRDGSPATEDCDDANPDLFPGQCGNESPTARAGADQVLECTADLAATATLDGSASSDPDGETDLASWVWSEGGSTLAEGKVATAGFALGAHDVVLTVTDRAGESGTDDLKVTVQDTVAPTGSLTAPTAGLCSAAPVTVEASFTDACDPELEVGYEPAPGPTYSEHGDTTVTVTATDAGGNAGSASVAFTIDTIAPEVAWLIEPGASITLPATVPMALVFEADDDDGASGGVVHERMLLDGCPIFDGATYGDGDGLLSDEALALDRGTLCRIASLCERTSLAAPVLTIEATDCAANVGSADLRMTGSVALRPGMCGKDGRPATAIRPATKPRLDSPASAGASPRPSIRR